MATITLDEKLLRRYEAEAKNAGVSLGETLLKAIGSTSMHGRQAGATYVLPTYDMGVPMVDLTKALTLAAEIEDEEFIHRSDRLE
jgi:hypothetical protein